MSVGVNHYLRRDDNRTRYFLGKTYALARHLEGRGPFVVALEGARVDDGVDVITPRDLAEVYELGALEDGGSAERLVAPTGRDERGTSLYLLDFARDVARWSGGMPLSIAREDEFWQWLDDETWDAAASTAFHRDPTLDAPPVSERRPRDRGVPEPGPDRGLVIA